MEVIKVSKRVLSGAPPDIAKAVSDKYSKVWNVLIRVESTTVTFAAIDKDHATDLAKLINDCAWVSV